MSVRELTAVEIESRVGTRHEAVGFEYPPNGLQPYYQWLIRSMHLLAEASAAALRVERDAELDTAVRITPGRATINGTPLSYGGGSHDLAAFNNTTALLWLYDDTGSGAIGVAPLGDGWPTTPHVRLAEATLAAGQIVGVIDRRFESMLSSAASLGVAPPVDDLTQTISDPPTQAQVAAIQNTLNDLLAALRAANHLSA